MYVANDAAQGVWCLASPTDSVCAAAEVSAYSENISAGHGVGGCLLTDARCFRGTAVDLFRHHQPSTSSTDAAHPIPSRRTRVPPPLYASVAANGYRMCNSSLLALIHLVQQQTYVVNSRYECASVNSISTPCQILRSNDQPFPAPARSIPWVGSRVFLLLSQAEEEK